MWGLRANARLKGKARAYWAIAYFALLNFEAFGGETFFLELGFNMGITAKAAENIKRAVILCRGGRESNLRGILQITYLGIYFV